MNLEKLKEEIEKADYGAKYDIFQILKKNNENMTTNNNGVFFDLETVSKKTIDEFVKYFKVIGSIKLFEN